MQSSLPVEMVETMENEHQGAYTEPALKPKTLLIFSISDSLKLSTVWVQTLIFFHYN